MLFQRLILITENSRWKHSYNSNKDYKMNKTQLQEKLLKPTKYSKWYLDIIFKAQSQNRTKLKKINEGYQYYENHHILPESIFKEYSDLRENRWNSVLLTAKEHFICHRLIQKHYQKIKYTNGDRKMSRAIDLMSKDGMHNAKHYENFKLNLSQSNRQKEIASKTHKNKIIPLETRLKMSLSRLGKQSPNKGKTIKPHTSEHKNKISKKMKGVPKSDVHKDNIGKANKGRRWKYKSITCPYCDRVGGGGAMTSHINKCKVKATHL